MPSSALLVAALLPFLLTGCLSRTSAPDYPPLEGAAMPSHVMPRRDGAHTLWEFRIEIANNTGQDMRLTGYDIAILDTDTGYTSRWSVVPARDTIIEAYGTYGYATDYRTISRFHTGREHRVYRAVGLEDGTPYEASFDILLLR